MVYDNSPKVYDELEEITGYSRKTLKTFKSIADRTADLRESTPIGDDVPYNHFKEIAPLPLKEQKEFLQKAADLRQSSSYGDDLNKPQTWYLRVATKM